MGMKPKKRSGKRSKEDVFKQVVLPNEVILYIFGFLDVPSLCNALAVSKGFFSIGVDDSLWKLHLHKYTLTRPFPEYSWIGQACITRDPLKDYRATFLQVRLPPMQKKQSIFSLFQKKNPRSYQKKEHQDRIHDIDWSLYPSKSTHVHQIITSAQDYKVIIWEPPHLKNIGIIRLHTGRIKSCAISPYCELYALGGWNSSCYLYNSNFEKASTLIGHEEHLSDCIFASEQTLITCGFESIVIWDTETSKPISNITDGFDYGDILSLDTSLFDHNIFAGCFDDGTVKIFDSRVKSSGSTVFIFEDHKQTVNKIKFSPNGSALATASSDGTSILFDIKTGKAIRKFHSSHKMPMRTVAFTNNGTVLNCGVTKGVINRFDTVTGKSLNRITGHTDMVTGVVSSIDGMFLASVGEDWKTCVWDVSDFQVPELGVLKGKGTKLSNKKQKKIKN